MRSCAEIPAGIDGGFDVICCPCGNGGTPAGIAAGLRGGQRAVGFAVLKGAGFLARDVAELQERTYGRRGMELEWAYVAKMMYGVYASVTSGEIGDGATVVAVITG